MSKSKMSAVLLVVTILLSNSTNEAQANDSQKIAQLEKRVSTLEAEITHLQEQEARASKYLKCIQGVKGNYLTFPIRVMNCLRK